MGNNMNEQQITNELLRKLLAQQETTNALLKKFLRRLPDTQTPKQATDPKAKEDQRIALAVVAIARGASTYQEIADELGVTRCTVSRNPGIRRAMEAAVRDRRVCSEAAEEFKFQKGR
jgi:CRP-like cAMP-binding protein